MLPVPLNSSKITSSMRLPLSIKAVATMVSEPPSSTLRAAGKNFPGWRRDRVISARETSDGIEQHHHVPLVFDQALGLFQNHLRDLNVPLRGLVERRADNLAFYRAL